MITRVQRWGNSHSLRLSKKLLADVEIDVGDEVDVAVRDGALVVTPVRRVRGAVDLEQFVRGIPGLRAGGARLGPPGRRGGLVGGALRPALVVNNGLFSRRTGPCIASSFRQRTEITTSQRLILGKLELAEPPPMQQLSPALAASLHQACALPAWIHARRRGAARTVGAAGRRGGRVVWQISCRIDAVKPPRLGSSEFERVGGEATERPESPACGDTRARRPSEAVRWWEERPTALTLG